MHTFLVIHIRPHGQGKPRRLNRMKEGIVISASWKLLKGSMLAALPILGVMDPRAFYKKALAIYRREMERLPE